MRKSFGAIHYEEGPRRTDYLYRVSIKCLIRNETGKVLVVKEAGRQTWDLPGGGMDHGEAIKSAIAREMKEEVNLTGDFTYTVIAVDEPAFLEAHNFWQVRLIFEVKPDDMSFSTGEDGDEVAFMNPDGFKDSEMDVERRIYRYYHLAPGAH